MDRGELFKTAFYVEPIPSGGFVISRSDVRKGMWSEYVAAFTDLVDLVEYLNWHASAPKQAGDTP